MNKVVVQIAGVGTIDKCDHCGTEYTNGFACFVYQGWVSINICNICFEKYYIEKNPK